MCFVFILEHNWLISLSGWWSSEKCTLVSRWRFFDKAQNWFCCTWRTTIHDWKWCWRVCPFKGCKYHPYPNYTLDTKVIFFVISIAERYVCCHSENRRRIHQWCCCTNCQRLWYGKLYCIFNNNIGYHLHFERQNV